jgi:hypothetical protein
MKQRCRNYVNHQFEPIADKLPWFSDDEMERLVGMRVPPDFNSFLSLSNGGIPRSAWFVALSESGPLVWRIGVLYGLNAYDKAHDLVQVNTDTRKRYKKKVLVVGSDGIDEFVISCERESWGCVVAVPIKDVSLVPIAREFAIAASFGEFVRMMEASPPEWYKLDCSWGIVRAKKWASKRAGLWNA